jgi:NAD(P)-dependent dehydrogenase (short-subunit alcohol dehydrogenase family)
MKRSRVGAAARAQHGRHDHFLTYRTDHRRQPRHRPRDRARARPRGRRRDRHLPLARRRRGRGRRGGRALGGKAVALQLDVGDVGSFDAFVASVSEAPEETEERETLDCLINNGGMQIAASFDETGEAGFVDLTDVHFTGVFFLTQKLLPAACRRWLDRERLERDDAPLHPAASRLLGRQGRDRGPHSLPSPRNSGRARSPSTQSFLARGLRTSATAAERQRAGPQTITSLTALGRSGRAEQRRGPDRGADRRRQPLGDRPAHRGRRRHSPLDPMR